MSVGQLARDCTGVVSLLWLRKFHNRNTVTKIRAEMMKPYDPAPLFFLETEGVLYQACFSSELKPQLLLVYLGVLGCLNFGHMRAVDDAGRR